MSNKLSQIFRSTLAEAVLTPMRVYGRLHNGVTAGILNTHNVSPSFAKAASTAGISTMALLYGASISTYADVFFSNPSPAHYAITAALASGYLLPASARAGFLAFKGKDSPFERDQAKPTLG